MEQDVLNKMYLLDDVKKIIEKHDMTVHVKEGCKNIYSEDCRPQPEDEGWFEGSPDGHLGKKYGDRISKGHYGFALGKPTPKGWVEALDEILELLTSKDDTFEIQQIKTKFGGVRFYTTSQKVADLFDIELLIDGTMFDEKMIY